MPRCSSPPLLLSLLLLLGGCQTYSSLSYEPAPAESILYAAAAADGRVLARTLVSIGAVHDADPDANTPPAVDVRIMVENTSDRPITLDPATLALVSGRLHAFDPPFLSQPNPVTLGPGQTTTVDATFPFPAGMPPSAVDMRQLLVRWTLDIDGQAAPDSVSFQRRRYSYPSYWHDPAYWHFGYRHRHGHHGHYGFHVGFGSFDHCW
ncbi:MAG: DUF4354 family protein [Phycisphaerae bacterium]|nr:DUF4354 family protein [Phycisphaerae bacterium]NNF44898.1 hypothetical protein [Phycisphaerales bacterium]